MKIMSNSAQCLKVTLASVLLLAVTACGNDPGTRAASGAGIGAGVGVGAAVLGAPLLPAVIIGGAVGAVTGAATSPKQIDLNK